MGYDLFDHYDLGEKNQKGTIGTRFGTKDELLRFIAVAHANGLEVYLDIVLNHVIGGEEDPSAEGDKFKRFRYAGFGGPAQGRWPKDSQHFHPNADHPCESGDICEQKFGPDMCYRDQEHGGGENGRFMRDQAREWMIWLTKQTDADGFRFDAVKHYPAYVVEDVLFHAMGPSIEFFCAGEFVGGQDQLDQWSAFTQNRCGTFDFSLRQGLADMIEAGGFFDMGRLPNFQQNLRLKTAPFINNHDTWRGRFWDSQKSESNEHDDREGDFRQNDEELAPTIDPDNPRADVAYAAMMAVDGSPVVYYEDLFINFGDDRFRANPKTIKTRDYLVNLIWAHQKLNFKDGAYRVPFQGSQDLLVLERAGKALLALNDHGLETQTATVQTSFGPNVTLHDYSGANRDNVMTASDGRVTIAVPKMSYTVWGPAGISGGFNPPAKGTIQEFQLNDDVGDSNPSSLRYGGKVTHDTFRTAGSIWAASHTKIEVSIFTEGERQVEMKIDEPAETGAKSTTSGSKSFRGTTSNSVPLTLKFSTDREGYHQVSVRLTDQGQTSTRAYVKVEYEAPAESEKF